MKFILTDGEIDAMKKQMFTEAALKAVEDYKNTEEAKRAVFNAALAEREAEIAARCQCAVHFNFNDPNLNVFSVERVNYNTDQEKTIVGYYVSEMLMEPQTGVPTYIAGFPSPTGPMHMSSGMSGCASTAGNAGNAGSTEPRKANSKMKEWTLFCSREQHNQLVAKFEESRGIYRGQENTKKQLLKG